ncbi:DNA-directed RNA polymerases II and IV subunit 5A-like isoform X2 [Nymphaea colorata]|uniref:DNA-directed RNA polymerases II and IV subunit 5A-like isoform X2 n=1 Tax=Nymphaea colorata TaxID=210225 RepID=UPI00129DA962|nr:DNA-directed RNA polymerases II and IV subunit 5A-like isoform X2 [Nymphaea colorata]
MAPKFAEDTVTLWRVRRTILQMLRDRHYNVDDSELKMNLNEFADRFGQSVNRDDLIIKAPKTDDRNDHIFVFFIGEAKVGVKIMRAYAERMRSENVLRGILVVREQLTPSSKQWIHDFNVKFHMEVFRLPRMLITDPVARYFGMKRGQVAKIIRKSETAGKYVTYRCVV